jgi:hypothetical protein
MTDRKVCPCGTKVVPANLGVDGIITCVSNRFGRIIYEVSYFYQGEYKSAYLNEKEFAVTNPGTKKIGFAQL